MIKTDGKPTIAMREYQAPLPPPDTKPRPPKVSPRIAKDREQYKRWLAERTKRESLDKLS